MRKLSDLNNHLFAQLERINDEDIDGEELQTEIHRSKAVSSIASQIISAGKLALEAQHKLGENQVQSLPKVLEAD